MGRKAFVFLAIAGLCLEYNLAERPSPAKHRPRGIINGPLNA